MRRSKLSSTPQAVVAVLKKAGFTRALEHPCRIRGVKSYDAGFSVARANFDHRFGSKVSYLSDFNQPSEIWLEKFGTALANAGYIISRGDSTTPDNAEGHYLWVRTPDEI